MPSSDLLQKLAAETGEITWQELQRHFARGVLIRVTAPLDLLEAAETIANNDTMHVSDWMAQGLLTRATDAHARAWAEDARRFRAVVVAPWVLVQELKDSADS